MAKTKDVEIKVRIINPEALPQASINFTNAVVQIWSKRNKEGLNEKQA